MFDNFQKRLSGALKKVRGLSRISESDVDAVLGEIRTGLLEADVHFRVAKDFLARTRERCLREDVIKSLSPEQQILKVLADELTLVLGGKNRELNFSNKPPVSLLLCGLQGSGKTTSAAKLGLYLKGLGKRPALVSLDIYRPAAREQLKSLSKQYDIPLIEVDSAKGVVKMAEAALQAAEQGNFDVLIVDTAGRLQMDEELMKELKGVHDVLKPVEKLLVVDAMMGQQAVEVAEGFDRVVELTGSILTKLDGDSRGGAALSLVAVTGKPIKFIGTGERATDFEAFHPDRMASRLLDMGDVLSLIEKAQQVISDEEALKATEKFRSSGDFTLEDFRDQLKMLSRMGPIGGLLKMLPGFGQIKEALDTVDTEKEMGRVNAILNSMTLQERRQPEVLNGSRRARIALGSGREVQEVNQLVKRFLEARKMMKQMGKMGSLMKGAASGAGSSQNVMANPFRKGGKGFGRKF